MGTRPPILVLGQGPPRNPDTWSGIPNQLIRALEMNGCDVRAADVEVSGAMGMLCKILSFAPQRRMWAANYHYGRPSYYFRSRLARREIARHLLGPTLQFGAQFCAFAAPTRQYYCYCDSNAFFGARSPYPKRTDGLSRQGKIGLIERERRVYDRVKKIFSFSEHLRQSFICDFGVPPEKVVTVYAGANLSELPPDFVVSRPRSDQPTILFIGREFERKGGRDLVEAFHGVLTRIPNARLIIAGANPPGCDHPSIEVVGFLDRSPEGREKLASLYRSADIFCMPSRYEAFGIVFVEAMLHGLPCVGTDLCAMPEIIDHERTGWIVPPEDWQTLSTVLIDALSNRERLYRMGAAGRKKALAHYTWDRVARAMCAHMGDV